LFAIVRSPFEASGSCGVGRHRRLGWHVEMRFVSRLAERRASVYWSDTGFWVWGVLVRKLWRAVAREDCPKSKGRGAKMGKAVGGALPGGRSLDEVRGLL
jgi:hypothetical protein